MALQTLKSVKGVKCYCDDGTVFVWQGPYKYQRFNTESGEFIESNLSVEEAHDFCDQHEVKQTLMLH